MTTSFFLAVDVGTSRTAAATARFSIDGTVTATPFALGRQAETVPSVIFVGDGEMLFGDAAARRGIAQPERLAREFKRRIGDDVPIWVGDRQFTPEQLYAAMVAWVISTVSEREGAQPVRVSVAVPVTWTGFRTDVLRQALAHEGWSDVDLIIEPVAAARHYESTRPLAVGRSLAIYDLGGGTFDTVILRRSSADDLDVVGEPVGLDTFGGSDFDDIMLRHVITAAGLSVHTLAADPTTRVALASLRRECVDAKESLSFDSEAVVPVLVGDGSATVRVTRSEFENMVEAGIVTSIDVLADALESADVDAADVEAILLTGGSSRIPRIAQLLSERFDRPIAIDADPKAVIALGAARVAAEASRAADATWPSATGSQHGQNHVSATDTASDAADRAPASSAASAASKQRAPLTWPVRTTGRTTGGTPQAGKKRFGLGTAAALTGGALMLAAGIAVSVGYPLLGDASTASESQPASVTRPVDEPAPSTNSTADAQPAQETTVESAAESDADGLFRGELDSLPQSESMDAAGTDSASADTAPSDIASPGTPAQSDTPATGTRASDNPAPAPSAPTTSTPSPTNTPLLSPAPPSDRIINITKLEITPSATTAPAQNGARNVPRAQ